MISATQTINFAREAGYDITERPANHFNIAVSAGIITIVEYYPGDFCFFNQEHFISAQQEFPEPPGPEPFPQTLFD